jgi:hypothetical protein
MNALANLERSVLRLSPNQEEIKKHTQISLVSFFCVCYFFLRLLALMTF